MVVISRGTLNEYKIQYPEASDAITKWFLEASTSDWANLNEIRSTFNSVDYFGNGLFIFNIMGNHYRLIVRIIFRTRTIFIRFFGTHSEYDKVNISKL
ncbi:type II toxin-antitoxin system HigB family toxin [Flavipsychrobacter stenotrophus]|uniref:Type II toxin-antitoxin system HigB family toxin n=1 Tax=Flavipsychrobacter stenotrophus TaxID=2077091 RepID=A0A2S7T1W9_9BACT|nr:type II toxin-antitoxin system HigB family toxin [Flavipsychrobacter stenotrophus]